MGVKTVTSRSHNRTKSEPVKVKASSGTSKMSTTKPHREKPLPKTPEPVVPSVLLPEYLHTSNFRSGELSLTLESPSVQLAKWQDQDSTNPIPVYNDQGPIQGSVAFAPQPGPLIGRLNVHVEGSFLYICSKVDMVFEDAPAELHSGSIRHRHVFHSAHAYLDLRANRTSSNIGGHSMISSVRDSGVSIQTQKPSASSSLKQIDEHNFAFTFGMPKSRRPQAELPPSLTTFLTSGVDVRGRTATDHMEVSYRFICSWEPFYEDEEDASIEVPILIHPDEQYPLEVGLNPTPDSWSEIPLLDDNVSGLPYHCLLTIPKLHVFPRNTSIPFYIIFAVPSTHKDTTLTRRLATTSILRIFLTRELTIDSTHPQWSVDPAPLPPAPPSSSHEFDSDNLPPPSGDSESSSRSSRSSTVLSPPESESGTSDASSSLYRTRREKMLQEKLGIRRHSAPLILFRVPPPRPPSSTASVVTPSPAEDARTTIYETESMYSAISAPEEREVSLVSEVRMLLSDTSEGFTKRGKMPGKRRSDMSMTMVVPDGMYRGELRLNGGMLPSMDWAGLSVQVCFVRPKYGMPHEQTGTSDAFV